MEYTNLNVRTTKETKQQAERIFDELGISTTTAFNIFLKQVIRENGIPFELKVNRPNTDTLAAMKEVDKMQADSKEHKKYGSIADLKEALGV